MSNDNILSELTPKSSRELLCEQLLPLSLFLYCFCQYFVTCGSPFWALLSGLIALCMYMYCIIGIRKNPWKEIQFFARFNFIFLIIIQFVLLLSPVWTEAFMPELALPWYFSLLRYVSTDFYAACFLSTFAFLVPISKSLLYSFGRCAKAGIFVFAILCLLNGRALLASSTAGTNLIYTSAGETSYRMFVTALGNFLMPTVLMAVFSAFLSKSSRLKAYSVVCIFLLLTLSTGGRGNSALTFCLLMLAFYGYSTGTYRRISWVLVLLMGSICVVFFLCSDWEIFSYIKERGMEDSRSFIEQAMIDDFQNTPIDWLTGRGLNGRYLISNYWGTTYSQRPWMETGYLYIILRGGFLYLIPYLLLLLQGFINGFFRSRNFLCKVAGLLMLLRILWLYPYGLPEFNYLDVAIWLLIGLCCQNKILQKTDDEIISMMRI